jgi:RNA polymerase sigma factor (sigma-70 family)
MLRLLKSPAPPASPEQDGIMRTRADDPLRALAARARSGDAAAEHTLLVAVGPAVLRVVRRVLGANHPDVRDTCQEASMALLSALPGFRGECSTLHFACRAAVLTSTNVRCRNRRRKRTAHQALEEECPYDELIDEAPSPAALADAARRRAIVRELLDELPLAQAETLLAGAAARPANRIGLLGSR